MRVGLAVLLLLSCISFAHAQLPVDDAGTCRELCNHAHLTGREQQVNYYQYPSMNKYDVRYLKLDLNAEAASRAISGTALTTAVAVQALDSFITELRSNMIIDSVFINGVKKTFQRSGDHVFIPLAPALPAGSTVNALFYYRGTASSAGVYAGTNSSGLSYTATLSESYQAREWFPAKQLLKDKIDSADIWITTSATNKVGSNGELVAIVDKPNSKKQYQWKSRHPISYYMPSFAVGNYMEYLHYARPAAFLPDSVPILHYVANNASYFNSIKTNLDKTAPFVEKLSELYGLYPFANEKYGHAQAEIGGGMEHQTMSTMSSFASSIIAHELGHQWFGDHVTCATWNHIWINEGFASYSEYLMIEKLPALFTTTTAPAYMLSVHNDVLQSSTGSVYVPEASVYDENRIFSSRFSYNKGSAIIHTLRFEMQSDTAFFNTLKTFQQQYSDSVATADDFKQVAETVSGKNLTNYFNQWYYGEGYPTFNVTYSKQGTDTLVLMINETVSAPAVTPFFKGLFEFTVQSAQGDTTIKLNVTGNNQQFKIGYRKTPNGIVVDPNNWVLNKTGTITNAGSTVPVQLISFEGKADGCQARLNWKTMNEQLSSAYEVEHSTNGRDFGFAASIASNNRLEESSYNYVYALSGSGRHYFRLKMLDRDGRFTYSPVVALESDCKEALTVSAYPNPVKDRLFLSIAQPAQGTTGIRLFNTAGKLCYSRSLLLQQGTSNITIDALAALPAGVYLLQVLDVNGKSVTLKIRR
jgi:aminopeptidase N